MSFSRPLTIAIITRSLPDLGDLLSAVPAQSFVVCPDPAEGIGNLRGGEILNVVRHLVRKPVEWEATGVILLADLDGINTQKVSDLPRAQSRLMGLLLAVMLGADSIVAVSFDAGLSGPAKHQLGEAVRRVARHASRQVYCLTQDPTFAACVGEEVWLASGKKLVRRWSIDEFTSLIRDGATYLITLLHARAARNYIRRIAELPFVVDTEYYPPASVRVVVRDPENIAALNWGAAFDLVAFQSLPHSLDPSVYLQGNEQEVLPWGQTSRPKEPRADFRPGAAASAALHVAYIEWVDHFRRFWGWGNLVFFSLIALLGGLTVAALAARGPGGQPHWLLAGLGAAALYSWPLVLVVALATDGHGLSFLVFGTLSAVFTLYLAYRVGSKLRRAGSGHLLGWLGYVFVLAASSFASRFPVIPWSWLWPYTGLHAALSKLLSGQTPWAPLAFSAFGIGVFWFLIRLVMERRANEPGLEG